MKTPFLWLSGCLLFLSGCMGSKIPPLDARFQEALATPPKTHEALVPEPPLPIDTSTGPAREAKARDMYATYEVVDFDTTAPHAVSQKDPKKS
ncbi:hypothetical protein OAN22_00205 [Alphaproteobacteria bacterium]|nr:hypothetical protein [Alphaproteobacteria bacterium]